MKKILFVLILLLSGCTSSSYLYKTSTVISEGNKNTIKIVTPDIGIAATRLKPVFESLLKQNGFKIVSPQEPSVYGFVYGITSKSWQSLETVPIVSPTSINSINSHSYGNINGRASYWGNGFGTFNGSYSGFNNASIDYNYGVTGYHNAVVDNFQINFTAMIMDYKTHEIVYEGHLIGLENISDDDFALFVEDVFSKYPFLMENDIELDCKKNGIIGACNKFNPFKFW